MDIFDELDDLREAYVHRGLSTEYLKRLKEVCRAVIKKPNSSAGMKLPQGNFDGLLEACISVHGHTENIIEPCGKDVVEKISNSMKVVSACIHQFQHSLDLRCALTLIHAIIVECNVLMTMNLKPEQRYEEY
jgi:hypothetical protein